MKTKESFKKRVNNEVLFVVNKNTAMSADGVIWDIAKEKKDISKFALKDDENIFYILTEKNAKSLMFTEKEINNIVEFLKEEEAVNQNIYIYFLNLKYRDKIKRKKKVNPSAELFYQSGIIEITVTIYTHELFNLKFSIYQKNIEFKMLTYLTQIEIDKMNTELYNDNGLTSKEYIYKNLLKNKDIKYYIEKEMEKYNIKGEIGKITLY